MLTLEYLHGSKVADVQTHEDDLLVRRRLAYLIAETWMTMIFRHGFFHGDPHPANILVLGPGRLGLVDFGQAGALTPRRHVEADRPLHRRRATRTSRRFPGRLADLGVTFPREQEQQFVEELREVFDRYYGARLSDVDPMQVIREAFALIYRMNLQLPTRFVLLDKAIATLGSVGVELYPDFNVFEVARPYARDLHARALHSPAGSRSGQARGPRPTPGSSASCRFQVHDVLEEVRDGQLEIGIRYKGLDELLHQFDILVNRDVVALLCARGRHRIGDPRRASRRGPDVVGIHRACDRRLRLSPSSAAPGSSGASSAPAGCRRLVTILRERTSGDRRGPLVASVAWRAKRCSWSKTSRRHARSSSGS